MLNIMNCQKTSNEKDGLRIFNSKTSLCYDIFNFFEKVIEKYSITSTELLLCLLPKFLDLHYRSSQERSVKKVKTNHRSVLMVR